MKKMGRKSKIAINGIAGFERLIMPNASSLDFVKDKQAIFNYLVEDMTARVAKMFKYENTPETFSAWAFEKGLQEQGFCMVWKGIPPKHSEGKEGIYALRGVGIGGELNDEYLPTLAVGSNPYLNVTISDELEDKNIVWAWNDSNFMGLSALHSLYAGLIAESYISLRLKLVLHRAPAIIVASNEDEKNEALKFLNDLDEGKLGVIGRKDTLNAMVKGSENGGFSTKPNSGDSSNTIKELIENIQYLYAQWNIKLGLNDNYNMKRESLNSSETSANEDTLLTLIDDMFECRKKAIEEMNAKFGTSIKVSLNNQWKRIEKRRDLQEEAQEKAVESLEEKPQEEIEEVKEDEEN